MAFDWFKRKALPVNTGYFMLNSESTTTPRSVLDYVREGYSDNPIVFACVSMIAEAAASVTLELHTATRNGDRKVDSKHPSWTAGLFRSRVVGDEWRWMGEDVAL